MELIDYKDFDTTIFEDELELICLNIDGIKMWTTPKAWRESKKQCEEWSNSPEYLEMEYKLWFGKDGN
jgi:hypothetical protein